MEKQREISAKVPPNAPPWDSVADVIKRIEALGREFHDVAALAGVSRSVSFALLRGAGSIASLHKIEDWLVKEETKKPKRSTSPGSKLEEWAALGEKLAALNPTDFERILNGLRTLVKTEEERQGAFVLMFRPNPDRPR